jgi:Fur family transcriptional regulator, peroxide stress response regulator
VIDTEERLEQMTRVLREKGCRLTPQRLALLKIIARGEGHPSAERIYELIKTDFPTTSLATIYNTLNLLKDMGEVLELNFDNLGSRYDGNKPYPHPHVICVKCGQILDSEFTAMAGVSLEMAQKTGFKITHYQLNFFGLCPECQRQGKAAEVKEE